MAHRDTATAVRLLKNMTVIEILKTGLIDQRESAFPQTVQLPGGDVLCSFSVGGGAEVTGGTDWARSTDGGETWNVEGTLLSPDTASGLANFLKFSLLPSGDILATAWTVTLGDYRDLPNSFCISKNGGLTWGPAQATGIQGQTLSTLSLGSDRLLVLYNRRYGTQAVMLCLVTFTEEKWILHEERILYDAQAFHQCSDSVFSGIDELGAFAFGFPTAISLADGTILAMHWCVENGKCGIRWTKLRVEW